MTSLVNQSPVSQTSPATPGKAAAHFAGLLALETDCWDTHEAIASDKVDFVLLDVRGAAHYEAGHVPTARHWPHGKLTERRLADFSIDTLFVVYCAGPHCNGADKAALRIANLGRPVKKMIGGVEGWKDEGFDLVTG